MRFVFIILLVSIGILEDGHNETRFTKENNITFAGSTPCDAEIRALNNIPANADCDKIKWKIELHVDEATQKPISYSLTSEWGYHVDNRTFEARGKNQSVVGKCSIVKSTLPPTDILILTDAKGRTLSFSRLDENLIHPLNTQNTLLKGNGGWSYTLSKVNPTAVPSLKHEFSNTPVKSPIKSDENRLQFHGRTPCSALADRLRIPKSDDCFKLKWSLSLHFDPKSQMPSTYGLERTGHRQSVIKGNWRFVRGAATDENALVVQLDPDKPNETLQLDMRDDQVLFFLDPDRNLLVGNEEFSYTLNRR